MPALTASELIGTWRVVRSDIPPPYNPGDEFFHFSSDGFHFWEYPFEPQHTIVDFRYRITEIGVRLTVRDNEHPRDLSIRVEGDLLVITGPHGYSSWLQRVPACACPSCLRHFYEPPENAREA